MTTSTLSDVSVAKPYPKDFYNSFADGSFRAARKVLEIVFEYLSPNSIADVGCGVGTWLAAAQTLGCQRVVGYDGWWVDPETLICSQAEFHSVQFEEDFQLRGPFDLCMSLEVAEHISGNCADNFVDQLCAASDVVLFSAAIPCQGGRNHVNEQPQSYWIKKFEQRSFECFDVIRPRIWNDESVEYWYRQNSFLFVRRTAQSVDREKLERDRSTGMYDIVHPGLFREKVEPLTDPGIRTLLRQMRAFVRAKYRTVRASTPAVSSKPAALSMEPADRAVEKQV